MHLISSFIASRPVFSRTSLNLIDTSDFGHLTDVSSLVSAQSASVVNAWSVSGANLNSEDLASSLFGASLFPYLAFLYFLARPNSKIPSGAQFGFRFLLFFVFATIPAGIWAKVHYNDVLANVDWLHGTAESMLTLTNLFLILGFRATRPKPASATSATGTRLNDISIPILMLLAALPSALNLSDAYSPEAANFMNVVASTFFHQEPSNALSIPTWAVHSSSLLEWLLAMKLIWEHAETSGNPRWKGLTWAMIPSHTSGICACTYHFFYNAPIVSWIVALQAFLTVAGNSCLALAAYRISIFTPPADSPQFVSAPKPLEDSDSEFAIDMIIKSVAIAILIKYGELAIDLPFQADPSLAASAIILIGTSLNVLKWSSRSQQQEIGQQPLI